MVTHVFNPNIWKAEARGPCEFEASLIYMVNSRSVRAAQRDPVSKGKKKSHLLSSVSVRMFSVNIYTVIFIF